MTTKDKPNFANAVAAQQCQEKAVEAARKVLDLKGIHYPLYDSSLSPDENYMRMLTYAEQEAAIVITYLRMPSGPRPLELDNVKPMSKTIPTRWNGYTDD